MPPMVRAPICTAQGDAEPWMPGAPHGAPPGPHETSKNWRAALCGSENSSASRSDSAGGSVDRRCKEDTSWHSISTGSRNGGPH